MILFLTARNDHNEIYSLNCGSSLNTMEEEKWSNNSESCCLPPVVAASGVEQSPHHAIWSRLSGNCFDCFTPYTSKIRAVFRENEIAALRSSPRARQQLGPPPHHLLMNRDYHFIFLDLTIASSTLLGTLHLVYIWVRLPCFGHPDSKKLATRLPS